MELLKQSGFQPLSLAVTDLLPSLQTGLVDAFAAPPAAALSFQWFALAPHMADLKWQPMPGATVVSAKAWGEIPAALRPLLEQAAADAGAKLQARIDQLNDQAVEAMRQRGLKRDPGPPRGGGALAGRGAREGHPGLRGDALLQGDFRRRAGERCSSFARDGGHRGCERRNGPLRSR